MKDNNTTTAMKELEDDLEHDVYSAIAHGLSDVEVNRSIVPDIGVATNNVMKIIARLKSSKENPVKPAKEGKSAQSILSATGKTISTITHIELLQCMQEYAEAYHAAQFTEVKGEEITALRQHNEVLKQAINQDKTGLAKGLADVRQLLKGYTWLTEGRGPYAYDDERYKGEVLNMINEIDEVALRALRESGTLATSAFHNLQAARSTHSSSETPKPKQEGEMVNFFEVMVLLYEQLDDDTAEYLTSKIRNLLTK
jgi:hypothetical protein